MPITIDPGDQRSVSDRAAYTPTSRLALASLALGVVSVFLPAGLLGIALGHWAMVRMRSANQRGKNVAAFALLLNYLGVLMFAVLMLLTSQAARFPAGTQRLSHALSAGLYRVVGVDYNRLNAPQPARNTTAIPDRERVAIDMVRGVAIAQVKYRAMHEQSGFTCDLNALVQQGLDDKLLNSASRNGYTLVLQGCNPDPHGLVASYQALAIPPTPEANVYCIDEGGLARRHSKSADECFTLGIPVQ